jgi:hypothetical protein
MNESSEAEPGWVSAVLEGEGTTLDAATDLPTVRSEFIRRVQRADLGPNRHAVLRAGLMAMDGDLDGDSEH